MCFGRTDATMYQNSNPPTKTAGTAASSSGIKNGSTENPVKYFGTSSPAPTVSHVDVGSYSTLPTSKSAAGASFPSLSRMYPLWVVQQAKGVRPYEFIFDCARQAGVDFQCTFERIGPDHEPMFDCTLDYHVLSSRGRGTTKSAAKQDAALSMLELFSPSLPDMALPAAVPANWPGSPIVLSQMMTIVSTASSSVSMSLASYAGTTVTSFSTCFAGFIDMTGGFGYVAAYIAKGSVQAGQGIIPTSNDAFIADTGSVGGMPVGVWTILTGSFAREQSTNTASGVNYTISSADSFYLYYKPSVFHAPALSTSYVACTVLLSGMSGSTVSISNFPATYPVTGSVTVSDGSIDVQNLQNPMPVSVSSSVPLTTSVTNFPAVQNIQTTSTPGKVAVTTVAPDWVNIQADNGPIDVNVVNTPLDTNVVSTVDTPVHTSSGGTVAVTIATLPDVTLAPGAEVLTLPAPGSAGTSPSVPLYTTGDVIIRDVDFTTVQTDALATTGASGPSGVVDVNVVAMSASSNPLWTSDYPSGRPVIELPSLAASSSKMVRRQWVSDLTACGDVESNPGPSSFTPLMDIEFLSGLAIALSDAHRCSPALAQLIRVLIDTDLEYLAYNPKLIRNAEAFERIADDPDYASPKHVPLSRNPTISSTASASVAPKTLDRAVPRLAQTPGSVKSAAQRAKNYQNVAIRISQRINSWDDMLDLICAPKVPLPEELLLLIMAEVSKRPAPLPQNEAKTVVNMRLNHSTRAQVLEFFIASSPTLLALGPQKDTAALFVSPNSLWSGEAISDPRLFAPWEVSALKVLTGEEHRRASEAEAHNRLMHSLNGNIDYEPCPNSMEAIRALPRAESKLYESASSSKTIDVNAAIARVSGVAGPSGINTSNVSAEMVLHASAVSAANAVGSALINAPELLLWPAQQRGVAGDIADNDVTPTVMGVQAIMGPARGDVQLSQFGEALEESIGRGGNIRANQTTDKGFKTADVAGLIKTGPVLSGDSCFLLWLKAALIEANFAWASTASMQPVLGQYEKVDPRSTTRPADPVLTYNSLASSVAGGGSVMNLDCGGDVNTGEPVRVPDCYFPFIPRFPGQDGPVISFHQSVATVDQNKPWFFIDPAMCNQSESGRPASNYFYIALLLSPYPSGIWSVLLETMDLEGGHVANEAGVPFSSLVSVPGFTNLQFVIASHGGQPVPATYAQATLTTLVLPTYGPTTTLDNGVYEQMQVNASGDPRVSYDLANYLYSWMGSFSVATLNRVKAQIANKLQRAEDFRAAFEMASCLSSRYQSLIEGPENAVIPPPAGFEDRTALQANCDAFGQNTVRLPLLPPVLPAPGGVVPQRVDDVRFTLPDINYMWWNKIMSDAYTPAPDLASYPACSYEWDNSQKYNAFMMVTSRQYAAVMTTFYQTLGFSTEAWNLAWTQNFLPVVGQTMRSFYAMSQPGVGNVLPLAQSSEYLNDFHIFLTGFTPARIDMGYSMYDLRNVPARGLTSPTSTLARGSVALVECVPQIICDIWRNVTCVRYLMGLSPFLGPNKMLTGIPDPSSVAVALGGGVYTLPTPKEYQVVSVPVDAFPVHSDPYLFNARLIRQLFRDSLLLQLNGVNPGLNRIPLANNFVSQRPQAPNLLVANPVQTVGVGPLCCGSAWFSRTTTAGEMLIMTPIDAPTSAQMLSIIQGYSQAATTTWLFSDMRAGPAVLNLGSGFATKFARVRGGTKLSRAEEKEEAPPAGSATGAQLT